MELIELAKALTGNTAALTGAGVSTPSGIPDFRGENGLWKRYNLEIYGSYPQFVKDPSYFWEMHVEIMHTFKTVYPNPAHTALAALEKKGKLRGIITQNIDGLHQKAGSTVVHELHGTNETSSCIVCGKKYDTNQISHHLLSFEKEELINLMRKGKEIPVCECGGWVKPDVILFGELMPHAPLMAARELAQSCDLLLVVGSSLQVEPACSLPFLTRRNNGRVAIINRERTPFDSIATFVFHGNAEDILPQLVQLV